VFGLEELTVRVRVGWPPHGPPPSVQVNGEMLIDQHWIVPTSTAAVSLTRSRQVPFTALAVLPLNSGSACCGRNVPAKGAEPALIGVAAESSKIVRALQLVP
jgi:hypothetical protein